MIASTLFASWLALANCKGGYKEYSGPVKTVVKSPLPQNLYRSTGNLIFVCSMFK